MTERETKIAPEERARRLVRTRDRGTLATLTEGAPYASLVLGASDHAGAPLLLLSDLAKHTCNIKADSRVSLLFEDTAELEDPLTGARVTLLGRAELYEGDAERTRYLARHPSAAGYAEFGDFNFYRVSVTRAHLVDGFGVIDWIDGDALACKAPELAAVEPEIVADMNANHANTIALYAAYLLGLEGQGWTMTGIDALGLDLRAGSCVARLEFAAPVTHPESARHTLHALAKAALDEQRQAS
ncbi:MAG: pyridoxamine 5'-phosphate oxidase family protein [Alphaproteobacteria bacterium]|nr:pyridoxamine 5'-phosphate oxidase family protein [Alphaproteobacteria bacterium]